MKNRLIRILIKYLNLKVGTGVEVLVPSGYGVRLAAARLQVRSSPEPRDFSGGKNHQIPNPLTSIGGVHLIAIEYMRSNPG